MFNNSERTQTMTEAPATCTEDFRKILPVVLFVDCSGSMAVWRIKVYCALRSLLQTLVDSNERNVDFHTMVRLVTFNETVQERSQETFLEPDDVLAMFSEDDYVCRGGTGFVNLYNKVSEVFGEGKGGVNSGIFQRFATPVAVFATDMQATDHNDKLCAAINQLHNDPHFSKCKRMVIFTGNQSSNHQAAVDLVGSDDYVIRVDNSTSDMLPTLLQNSFLVVSNSTNVSNLNTTPKQIGREVEERMQAGKQESLTMDEKKTLDELIKLANELPTA